MPAHSPLDTVDHSREPRRLLVVEDDGLLAALLAEHLGVAGFSVRTAPHAAASLGMLDEFDPDAVVLDIDLGVGPSGLDLAHEMVRRAPHLAIVFLTQVADPRFVGHRLPDSVPVAYLRKGNVAHPAEVLRAIEAVLAEAPTPDMRHEDRGALSELSPAQFDLLRMIAEGLSNAEIAQQRGTTERAVEHLVRRALKAAGVEGGAGNRRVLGARAYMQASGARIPAGD